MTVVHGVLAALLAVFYLYSGGLKLLRRREQLRPMMRWVDTVPMAGVRTLGVLEVLGAIGLVLPPLIGVAPGLAVAAAVGLALLQLLAVVFHLRRGETRDLWLNGVLLVLAVLVAWTTPVESI